MDLSGAKGAYLATSALQARTDNITLGAEGANLAASWFSGITCAKSADLTASALQARTDIVILAAIGADAHAGQIESLR
jgi:hypothetical protein